ncbi:hydrogenase maturation nickel metallochaperone HypA [Aeromonas simiae]|uniref:hydrogenase maturation nickel metallochaperone HypA n=1 Tax=Aeromonas simiae TaxID=218936 RepID=UPI0005A72C03|nr:hydrogenase maturation nickel metallochaperone HypA [Aeromonas simiae]MDO2948327.1 hydrogenase maturation nickel metallochaperone HypA [Aeromonas simiae]MDO2955710.1 hydrogenase maturation nickel metallochaperone HypA [Aeromonas simiae]
MHEMSLAMSTIDLVVETATRQGFSKVTGVWLEVGRLSCVEADTIAFCFEAAARATPAEGARLHIEHKGAEAWCYECHLTVTLEQRGQSCPQCGGFQLRVAQGDSLRVTNIEVA